MKTAKKTINRWIKINIPYGPVYGDSQQNYIELDSFVKRKLNKPGTLVEVGDKKYLIGDINRIRGVCDDCVMFSSGDIVLKYKVVYKKD